MIWGNQILRTYATNKGTMTEFDLESISRARSRISSMPLARALVFTYTKYAARL